MSSTAVLLFAVFTAIAASAVPQQSIPLTVPAGAPLRVYLTRRLPKKVGQPVHAKLFEPVFAFNREVLPAGAEVLGHVSRLAPVPIMQRAAAIINGDFTPLHRAE